MAMEYGCPGIYNLEKMTEKRVNIAFLGRCTTWCKSRAAAVATSAVETELPRRDLTNWTTFMNNSKLEASEVEQ